MNADGLWRKIRSDLADGMELKAWSRDKGYTKVTFQIADKPPGAILITSPTLSKPRTISQNDFANVAAIWAAYCKGKISHGETAELSQNMSYIFGLLKWAEDKTRVGERRPASPCGHFRSKCRSVTPPPPGSRSAPLLALNGAKAFAANAEDEWLRPCGDIAQRIPGKKEFRGLVLGLLPGLLQVPRVPRLHEWQFEPRQGSTSLLRLRPFVFC